MAAIRRRRPSSSYLAASCKQQQQISSVPKQQAASTTKSKQLAAARSSNKQSDPTSKCPSARTFVPRQPLSVAALVIPAAGRGYSRRRAPSSAVGGPNLPPSTVGHRADLLCPGLAVHRGRRESTHLAYRGSILTARRGRGTTLLCLASVSAPSCSVPISATSMQSGSPLPLCFGLVHTVC